MGKIFYVWFSVYKMVFGWVDIFGYFKSVSKLIFFVVVDKF